VGVEFAVAEGICQHFWGDMQFRSEVEAVAELLEYNSLLSKCPWS
jgi:hypothetical protein